MLQISQPRYVTEIELEKMTSISRKTWQKHRLLGTEPRFYKINGSVRYDLNEVLAWIRSNARKATGAEAVSA